MRLLHVINSTNPTQGGPVEGVKQLGHSLTKAGVEVTVACCDHPDAPWLKGFPLDNVALGPSYSRYGYAPRLYRWLLENAETFDHIVVNGIWQYHGFATRMALRRLRRHYVVFTHGMLDPWFKQAYPLKHLKKSLYWPLGEYPVLRDAATLMFTSAEECELAPLSFTPNAWTSTIMHYGTNGTSGDPEQQREGFLKRFPELKGKRCVLFLGRVTAKKGVDLLIRAFAAVSAGDPDLVLVLAGPVDEHLKGPLERLAQRLGVAEKIVWTGMLLDDDKWGAFRASDVFVLPSHQENFGISVAESLSCGLSVLISNKVNIWREVQEAGAGFVAADTAEGTESLLRRWLALGPAEAAEMSVNSRRLFCDRFDMSVSALAFIGALEQLDPRPAVPASLQPGISPESRIR